MTIEIRKRPVIKGKDALIFLKRAEQNQQQLVKRQVIAIKKWTEQQQKTKDK